MIDVATALAHVLDLTGLRSASAANIIFCGELLPLASPQVQ